jgi:hypothetical protein
MSCDQPLPTIEITKDEAIKWDEKESCLIRYHSGSENTELDAEIKLRGGVSSRYDKHSYRIELKEKYGLGGLPPDDDWILNANYIDKTFMRHKISYDLFRQMNRRNVASKCAYVNVIENGRDQGLYVLMEKVNASMVGLDKKDSLALLFKDPPVFYQEKLQEVQEPQNYYQQKYPKIDQSNQSDYLGEFRDLLFNSSDIVFAQTIFKWVDLENITDWHLLLLLTNNSDGIMKNFYLYKIDSKTRFRVAIWDYDHSFGRDGDNEMNMMERELDCRRSVLFRRLMEIPELRYNENLRRRWGELRKSGVISNQNIEKLVQENDRLIRKAVEANFKIWPVDSKWYFDDNNYPEERNVILDFSKLRISQLDERFQYLGNE